MELGRMLQMASWVTVDTGLSDGTVIAKAELAATTDRLAPFVVSQPVTTTVRQLFLTVTGDASPNPITVGQDLQFTITVRNDGGPLQSVTVTDRLPSGVSFLGCGGALCEFGGDQPEVKWWLSSLPSEGEQELTLRVSVGYSESGVLVNDLYGAWVPEARRFAKGQPITVNVSSAPSQPFSLHLPLLFSSAVP
jgi:uncharacterized repeat protein (TIGR01451 family)